MKINNDWSECDVEIGYIYRDCPLCAQIDNDIDSLDSGKNENCFSSRSASRWNDGKVFDS
jgi:hypothetical protein